MNKDKLLALLNTLNDIEVHGKRNMDMMLGCIITIEEMLKGEEKDG